MGTFARLVASMSAAAALACGGVLDAEEQPARGASSCRALICGCDVLDPRTLEPRLRLDAFSVEACSDQPWLEASRACMAAAGVPCACSTCDARP